MFRRAACPKLCATTLSRPLPLSRRWHDLNCPQTFLTRRINHSRYTYIDCSAFDHFGSQDVNIKMMRCCQVSPRVSLCDISWPAPSVGDAITLFCPTTRTMSWALRNRFNLLALGISLLSCYGLQIVPVPMQIPRCMQILKTTPDHHYPDILSASKYYCMCIMICNYSMGSYKKKYTSMVRSKKWGRCGLHASSPRDPTDLVGLTEFCITRVLSCITKTIRSYFGVMGPSRLSFRMRSFTLKLLRVTGG